MSAIDAWIEQAPRDEGAPEWLQQRRAAALDVLRVRGLPGRRDEEWRDTPTRAVLQTPLHTSQPATPVPSIEGAHRLVFGANDDDSALPSWITRWAGVPPRDLLPEAHVAGTPALNAALTTQGALVELPAGEDGGVLHLVHQGPSAARHRLRLGARARLIVVEHHVGGAGVSAPLLQIELAPGASLLHLQLQSLDDQTQFLGRAEVRLDADARYTVRSFLLGGQIARAELRTTLAGAGARVDLAGLGLGRHDQTRDHLSLVEHAADDTASDQRFRAVLDDRARAVFNGLVRVHEGVHGIDAVQGSRGMLLSDDAQAHSRPQLEIYADDVSCTHGATVGQLDEEALFFMRARGLSRDDAARLMLRGFAAEALAGWPEEAGRSLAERAMDAWLGGSR